MEFHCLDVAQFNHSSVERFEAYDQRKYRQECPRMDVDDEGGWNAKDDFRIFSRNAS